MSDEVIYSGFDQDSKSEDEEDTAGRVRRGVNSVFFCAALRISNGY